MHEREPTRIFEIIFRSSLLPRTIVLASPHLPLPRIPRVEPPPKLVPVQPAVDERRAIEQVLARLRESADQLGSRCDSLLAELRQAAIELAVAVAGRLLFDKLQGGEFPIEEMVRQAVARLPAAPSITVYLHPDDLKLLRQRLGDEQLLPASGPDVRLEADAALGRGGCRAEAGEIHVLADLAEQLAELRQHLLWSASHAQSEPAATSA